MAARKERGREGASRVPGGPSGAALAAAAAPAADGPCASDGSAPARPASRGAASASSASAAAAPRGVLVTFEGGDGAGKSTHIRFLARALVDAGREVVCLREPGGTPVGEALRAIVLDPANEGLADEAELLIYEAARAQLTAQVIRPALERGAVVLCDRFFDSTVAYQVAGRGLPASFVDAANAFATGGVAPDRTLVLSAGDARSSLGRATHGGPGDRLERAGADFHGRVNEAFLELARREPARVRVVDSSGARSATAAQVFAELADLFPWMADAERYGADYFSVLDDKRALKAWLASAAAPEGGVRA